MSLYWGGPKDSFVLCRQYHGGWWWPGCVCHQVISSNAIELVIADYSGLNTKWVKHFYYHLLNEHKVMNCGRPSLLNEGILFSSLSVLAASVKCKTSLDAVIVDALVSIPETTNELMIEVLWKLFSSNLDYIFSISLQVCTCHDSSAVVACAKLWPDRIIIFHIKNTRKFTRFR